MFRPLSVRRAARDRSPLIAHVGLALALVIALVLIATAQAIQPAQPAQAAPWPLRPASARTGTLTAAVIGHEFTPLNAVGTGGARFTASKMLNDSTTAYVNLRNKSTVPVRLTGSVDLSSFGATLVTINRCSLPWNGSTCPGLTTAVSAAILPTRLNVVWAPSINPGAAVYLRIFISGTLANQVTLDAKATSVRAPGDRSKG
ncbi:hypothetical protein ACFQ46_18120 [Kineococcus sp. GCM10028916]|uniref:hypothetical protein n=1 Tax=Kineococcus sp. GCM10028916 TaxID=3273394 RepID=UPI0036326B6B